LLGYFIQPSVSFPANKSVILLMEHKGFSNSFGFRACVAVYKLYQEPDLLGALVTQSTKIMRHVFG